MATQFRVRAHGLRSGDVIDVYDRDEFVASVYTAPAVRCIRVISRTPIEVQSRDDGELYAITISFAAKGEPVL